VVPRRGGSCCASGLSSMRKSSLPFESEAQGVAPAARVVVDLETEDAVLGARRVAGDVDQDGQPRRRRRVGRC